jgi:two-component system CheB/CheR fusion protein
MPAADDARALDALLHFLTRSRGFDFTGYKRTTFERRLRKRMQLVGADSYESYLDLLEAEPDEFAQLFDTLLINVTRFFRDDAPWRFLAQELVPMLLAGRAPTAPIRVWSAGCASGEEAYSLAMVLAEALGLDAFRERVKIYATDVDEHALAAARAASYDAKQAADVPPPLLERYFEPVESCYVVRKELRRRVIFGRNDLVQDAPISRIDLLVCRNTLMYFNAPTQAAILGRFHFALSDGGILFLGRAETLLSSQEGFEPLDLKRRLFGKVPRVATGDRSALSAHDSPDGPETDEAQAAHARDAAFEAGTTAQVVIDRGGRLLLANERARVLFSLMPSDVGRPLQDLELSYRPVELRSLVEQCYADRRPVVVREAPWRQRATTEERWLDVELTPLVGGDDEPVGVSISFVEATTRRKLRIELEESRESLEAAYEELQSTNEELETTNEELQSTVEELETTNEELQSTNEELETMNEELQSMNEELQASNEELHRSSEELNEVNAFLEGVFATLRGGVAVIDREQRVLVWNARAEELWGVRSGEVVGTSFLQLDIGLPVTRLAEPIRNSLNGTPSTTMVLDATNRRGRRIACRVTTTALQADDGAARGAIVVMEELEAGH